MIVLRLFPTLGEPKRWSRNTSLSCKETRLVGRNIPLALMVVAIGVLFWPKTSEATLSASEGDVDGDQEAPRSNGVASAGGFHEAA